MGQVTVCIRVRLRSKGKQPEKMVGREIDAVGSPIPMVSFGRRERTLRFGAGPREERNGAS